MHIGSTIGRAALLACLAWSAAHPLAHAQDAYPNRPVTLTHGFAAGGNGDVISRIVGEGLSSRLGQPFVVEARPGAGGNTASRRLASSPPDGYTLITLTGGHAVSAALYKSLPFHPVDDFQMITTYGYTSFMVAVKKDSPIKTVADLIAAAKAAPGKLTFSSVGVGSTQHLSGELFAVMAGIKMTHVPYRGGTAPITDLIGGQIDVAFDSINVIEPQFRSGNVHVIGVTSPTPWWSAPDVPPVSRTIPGYDVQSWLGLAAPQGTPLAIVQSLNATTRAALSDPAVKGALQKSSGMDVRATSPQEMKAMVESEIAKWKKVIADANIPQR